MERLLGPFGPGDWKTRKIAAIADDCRIQADGVFVTEDSDGTVVGYVTTRLNPGIRSAASNTASFVTRSNSGSIVSATELYSSR